MAFYDTKKTYEYRSQFKVILSIYGPIHNTVHILSCSRVSNVSTERLDMLF